jgi:UDP-N-acetylmuramyl pentapeptide phosphotransferase/UDP-N-acetylglucosamine-1-phosphate transferase
MSPVVHGTERPRSDFAGTPVLLGLFAILGILTSTLVIVLCGYQLRSGGPENRVGWLYLLASALWAIALATTALLQLSLLKDPRTADQAYGRLVRCVLGMVLTVLWPLQALGAALHLAPARRAGQSRRRTGFLLAGVFLCLFGICWASRALYLPPWSFS